MSADALELVVRDKTCCYKLVELMYNSLLKDEVFSAGSALCRVWISGDPALSSKADAWKNMTKDLIRYTSNPSHIFLLLGGGGGEAERGEGRIGGGVWRRR